jgi:hypothetical protein
LPPPPGKTVNSPDLGFNIRAEDGEQNCTNDGCAWMPESPFAQATVPADKQQFIAKNEAYFA